MIQTNTPTAYVNHHIKQDIAYYNFDSFILIPTILFIYYPNLIN